jgi:hypothetical protein
MAKSPFYVESKPLTRSDELREQINELEAMIGRMGYGLGQGALAIPALFDSISTSLASFQAAGQSMRAEETRLETVSARLRRKADVFLREIGGASVLRESGAPARPRELVVVCRSVGGKQAAGPDAPPVAAGGGSGGRLVAVVRSLPAIFGPRPSYERTPETSA